MVEHGAMAEVSRLNVLSSAPFARLPPSCACKFWGLTLTWGDNDEKEKNTGV